MGRWFPRKQALTVGVSTSGTSAGGVVFPLMIERLLVSVGFSWTMRAAAGLIAIMCAVACVTIEAPPPGYGGRPPAPKIKGVRARLAPFKQRRFVLTVLGLALFANGYFVVLIFVVTVARTRGWQNPIEALIVLNGTRFVCRRRATSGGPSMLTGRIAFSVVLAPAWPPNISGGSTRSSPSAAFPPG